MSKTKKYIVFLFCFLSNIAIAQLPQDLANFASKLQTLSKMLEEVVYPPVIPPGEPKILNVPPAGGMVNVPGGVVEVPAGSMVEIDKNGVLVVRVSPAGGILKLPSSGGIIEISSAGGLVEMPDGSNIDILGGGGMVKVSEGGTVTVTSRDVILQREQERQRQAQVEREKLAQEAEEARKAEERLQQEQLTRERLEQEKREQQKREQERLKKEQASQVSTDKPIVVPPSRPIGEQQLSEDDFITALYEMYKGLRLYIPKKEMFDVQGKPVDLKILFEKYQIVPVRWDDKTWEKATATFTKRATKENKYSYLTPHDLPKLLETAKSIIKSFLLKDDNELPMLEKNSIKKTGLNRLFTYAKMQRVIKEDKLSHVRLPRKVLVIKNTKTGEFVPSNEASKVIDDILKIYMVRLGLGEIRIGDVSDDYKLIIFANKEKHYYGKLSQEAIEGLQTICQKAPFDVGYDNIFTDSNGDAVIIDTENKGEPSQNCLKKLNRYF